MTKVLITGATGNVGIEVIMSLQSIGHQLDIYAVVRSLTEDCIKLSISIYGIKYVILDVFIFIFA